LDEVAIDLPGTDTLDRMRGAGAVRPRARARREIGVAHLRDQVETKLERNTIRILGADQDEPAAFLVVAADQEFREPRAFRLGGLRRIASFFLSRLDVGKERVW